MNKKTNEKLKSIINNSNVTIVPGAFNAISAKMIEQQGFEAMYLSGAGLTNAQLGLPDLAFMGLKDLVDAVISIRSICEIPLIVDADTGFGNAINVTRTVKMLEHAGANAMQLEDQLSPKKCGHFKSKHIIDLSEARDKIRAAVDARQNENFIIIARTDACSVEGFESAIERANAFVEDGADVTFIESPKTIEEIKSIPKRINAPQLINFVYGGITPILNKNELNSMGYSIALYANAALQSAMLAMQETLNHIYTNASILNWEKKLIHFDDRQKIVNKEYFDLIEKKFSSTS